MPLVRFEPAGVEVDVPSGERLIDVCDDHPEAGVALSCRDASCGTCQVRILVGAEHLAPPIEPELTLLTALAAPPSTRLACQLRLEGTVLSFLVLAPRAGKTP